MVVQSAEHLRSFSCVHLLHVAMHPPYDMQLQAPVQQLHPVIYSYHIQHIICMHKLQAWILQHDGNQLISSDLKEVAHIHWTVSLILPSTIANSNLITWALTVHSLRNRLSPNYTECRGRQWHSQINQIMFWAQHAHVLQSEELKLSNHIHSDMLQGTYHTLHIHTGSMLQ